MNSLWTMISTLGPHFMPRVLNYKREDLLPGAVYIGPPIPGLPRSKWRNPYKIGRDGTLEEVTAKFERHLYDSGLINQIHELRGRDLVCWCAPEPCHGDVLLRLANERDAAHAVTNRSPGAASPRGCVAGS